MIVKVGEGVDESVALTANESVVSSWIVSVVGAFKTGAAWFPTVTVMVVLLVSDPPVPITVTWNIPELAELTVRVEVAVPVMLALLSETDKPVGLEVVSVTVDANPLRMLRPIVVVP